MHAFFLQSCFKYYMSDDINKDEDGMDEQCRLVQNICFYLFITLAVTIQNILVISTSGVSQYPMPLLMP